MLNAFKNGVTVLNQDNLNQLIEQQSFKLIFIGTQLDAKTGSGVTENSLATASFCASFVLTGSTTLGRIELELDKDGTGADLTVEIRSGMVPASGNDGTLLKSVVVPKEFIPDPKGWWSIPVNLTGLTAGATYWILVRRNGDSTNKNDWISEASADGTCYYRNGDTGVWSAANTLHLKVFSGNTGNPIHGIYGTNLVETYVWSGFNLVSIYQYCPPADGSAGGIRRISNLTYDSAGTLIEGS